MCPASYVCWQRDTARICCWAPAVLQSIDISWPPRLRNLLLCAVLRRRCRWSPAAAAVLTHSSKPAGQMIGQTDRQTNGRTPGRFIDSVPHSRWIKVSSHQLNSHKRLSGQCNQSFAIGLGNSNWTNGKLSFIHRNWKWSLPDVH